MQELLEKIDKTALPRHVAIIMDGNGRWAKEKGQDRLYGHFHGVESVRNIVESATELGIEYLPFMLLALRTGTDLHTKYPV